MRKHQLLLLLLGLWTILTTTTTTTTTALVPVSTTHKARPAPPTCPEFSPATGLENRFYTWKEGQQIRYQCTTAADDGAEKRGGGPVLLVHGLFTNADHWRKSLAAFRDGAGGGGGGGGYTAYAIDLFGCGYSDKPPAASATAQRCNGENGRFENGIQPSVLRNVELGTANGRDTRVVDVELRHPLGSPYNFYTWAEQIADFCRDVILKDDPNRHSSVTLVCNSIGTSCALQAVMDRPELFKGVFVVCPNFRELHSAEVPFPALTMPVLRANQRLLRERGQPCFDYLAQPAIVKNILKVPYAVTSAVDDELVQVLLDPLLTPGSSQVVFDSLSYSAGPLPEQQLQQFPENKPVWICYGDKDPWTPGPRVEALIKYKAVERVVKIAGVGHCPHDEAPELVHPLLFEFLKRLGQRDA